MGVTAAGQETATRRVTILDGGMGKELRRIGAPFRQPEWSALALMEAPDMVATAHRNFVEAGADVITTNNYAVVPYHLGDDRFAIDGPTLVERSGRLARQVADESHRPVQVAGSLPPLFGSYEPDRFDPARAAPLYRQLVETLEPWVDLWLGETLSCVAELDAVAEAVGTVGSTHPVWVSFAVPDAWDPDLGIAVRSGESMGDIAEAAADRGRAIEAVLCNCSLPEQTGPALTELRRALDERGLATRTGGYANAFPTTRSGTYQANEVIFERRAELTPDRYADAVTRWVADGATIVGGCCDMYPEHIAALVDRLR